MVLEDRTQEQDIITLKQEMYTRLKEGDIKFLRDEEKNLLMLRSIIYNNNWIEMLNDMNNRLISKPFIPKSFKRISEDVVRIGVFKSLGEEGRIYSYNQEKDTFTYNSNKAIS